MTYINDSRDVTRFHDLVSTWSRLGLRFPSLPRAVPALICQHGSPEGAMEAYGGFCSCSHQGCKLRPNLQRREKAKGAEVKEAGNLNEATWSN